MELTKNTSFQKKGHQFKKYIIKKKYCFHIYSFVFSLLSNYQCMYILHTLTAEYSSLRSVVVCKNMNGTLISKRNNSHDCSLKEFLKNIVCYGTSRGWRISIRLLVKVEEAGRRLLYMSGVKRICVFEHSVMTKFNCACPAIQRG